MERETESGSETWGVLGVEGLERKELFLFLHYKIYNVKNLYYLFYFDKIITRQTSSTRGVFYVQRFTRSQMESFTQF